MPGVVHNTVTGAVDAHVGHQYGVRAVGGEVPAREGLEHAAPDGRVPRSTPPCEQSLLALTAQYCAFELKRDLIKALIGS